MGEEGGVVSEAGIGLRKGSLLPPESLQGQWGQLRVLGVSLTQ